MPASRAQARDDIGTIFKTAWDAQATVPPVVWPDTKEDDPTSGDWARVTIQHTPGRQTSLGRPGGRRFTRFGFVTVQIFTVIGDGLTDADAFSKVAAEAFEGVTSANGVKFRRVRSLERGKDGIWFATDVIAEFEYDEIR